MDPLLGTVLNGRFELVAFLARGGMGKVYRARQRPLGRLCAVKILEPAPGAHGVDFHRRFFLEASIAARLTHPNTVTVFDYGRTDDDRYFLAMEYLDGVTLKEAMKTSGPFPESRALHIARQIARSLREAHGMGVVHRDVKPANVLLVRHGDEPDFAKVLDFGLVKETGDLAEPDADRDATQAGVCLGSPKYMAPEQVHGVDVDVRADIYSLGVVLYEMLTGRPPFDKGNAMSTLLAHVGDAVPPLRVVRPDLVISPELEAVVLRCLAKAPGMRFASMDDLLAALRPFAGAGTSGEHVSLPASAIPASVSLPLGVVASVPVAVPPKSRRRGVFASVLAAASVAAATAILGLAGARVPSFDDVLAVAGLDEEDPATSAEGSATRRHVEATPQRALRTTRGRWDQEDGTSLAAPVASVPPPAHVPAPISEAPRRASRGWSAPRPPAEPHLHVPAGYKVDVPY